MDLPLPQCLGSNVIFDGRRLSLEIQQFQSPDGSVADREIVRHQGSVAILALRHDDAGRREVLIEQNYRYPLQRYLLEIPAGTLDVPGEAAIDCARRELIEETGFRALSIRPLLTLHPSPGILTEMITIFIADQLQPAEAATEPGELIHIQWIPWDQLLERIRQNEITDAKTIAAVLYAQLLLPPV